MTTATGLSGAANVTLTTTSVRVQPNTVFIVEGQLNANKRVTSLWEIASLGSPVNLSSSVLTTTNKTFSLNAHRNSISFSAAIDTSYLTPGGSYLFTILASSTGLSTSSASITVTVNQPPSAGYLTVSPSSGVAFNTTFTLTSVGWNVEAGGYPLQYAFSFQLTQSSTALSLSAQSLLNYVATALPIGLPNEQYVVLLTSTVEDAYSATASAISSAIVYPLSFVSPLQVLNNFVANANISELSSDINLALQSVNNVATYFKLTPEGNVSLQDTAIGAMCDTLTTVVSTLDSSSTSLTTIITSFQHLYNTSSLISISSLTSCLQLLSNLSTSISGNLPNTFVSPTALLVSELVSLFIESYEQFNSDNSTSAALAELSFAPTLDAIITALTDGVLSNMVGGQAPVSLTSQKVDINVYNALLTDLYNLELVASDSGLTSAPTSAPTLSPTVSGGLGSNPNLQSSITLPLNGLDSCGSSVSGYAQLSVAQLLGSAYPNASNSATPLLRISSSKSNYVQNSTFSGIVTESASNFTLVLPFTVLQDFSPTIRTVSNATFTTVYSNNHSAHCFIQTSTSTAPCDCSLVSFNSANVTFTCPVRSGICTSLTSSVNLNNNNNNNVQGGGYSTIPDITQYGALIESAFK